MSAFRAEFVLDLRAHRLAWSLIGAGLMACVMLWASILGAPLARTAASEMDVPTVVIDVEHPIEMAPEE